jgi:hypothetical protein
MLQKQKNGTGEKIISKYFPQKCILVNVEKASNSLYFSFDTRFKK